MNVFVKNLKTSMGSEDYSSYQANAKNYQKVYNILVKDDSLSGESLKENVMSWFFSLPLESRIKIATVESKFLVSMLHQMYFNYKSDTRVLFQMKGESKNETNKEKILFRSDALSDYREEDMLQNNLMNYFNFKSSRSNKNEIVEPIFIKDVRFYSIHSDIDSFTLNPRVLQEKGLFSYYMMKHLSNAKCFQSLIKPLTVQDGKSKIASYSLPLWMDLEEFYTIGNFITAFIEQAILIKFLLNYNVKNNNNNSAQVFSIINENRMGEVFEKRKQVITCLTKYFDKENKPDLFDKVINAIEIHNAIHNDPNINKFVKLKNRHYDTGYMSLHSKKMQGRDFGFAGNKASETERKIVDKFMKEHLISFVDECIYHNIDSLWKFNYFISLTIFKELHRVYTDKNYEELVKEMESLDVDDITSSKGKQANNNNQQNKNGKRSNNNKDKGNNLTGITGYLYKNSYSPLDDPDFSFYSVYFKELKIPQISDFSKKRSENIRVTYIKSTKDNFSISVKERDSDCDCGAESENKLQVKEEVNLNHSNNHDQNNCNVNEKETEIIDNDVIITDYKESDSNINNGEIISTKKEENIIEIVTESQIIEKEYTITEDSTNTNPNSETIKVNNRDKKKKKEPNFFLYETNKRKKEKQHSNNNIHTTKASKEKEPKEKTQTLIEKKKNSQNESISNNESTNRVSSPSNSDRNLLENNPNKNVNNVTKISNNNYYFVTQGNPISSSGNNMMINPMMMRMNPTPPQIQMRNNNPLMVYPMNPMNPLNPMMHNQFPDYRINSNPVNSNQYHNFIYKLHNDIISYHKSVTQTLSNLKEVKLNIIKYIEEIITNRVSQEFTIDLYGSFASDLSIESSDIDIKIKLKPEIEMNYVLSNKLYSFDPEETILLFVKQFNSLNTFESITPIYKASVPIIKLVIDPQKIIEDENLLRLEEFKHSPLYKNYRFPYEELHKIKVDLTFVDLVNKMKMKKIDYMPVSNGVTIVAFTRSKLLLYPEIKPILQILKRYLQMKKLNNCFNGGLSSYCLFLLILAFIQYKHISEAPQNNLGKLLLDFLEFYGRVFNFQGYIVDVNQINPFFVKGEIYDNLPTILDPLAYHNAAKSSFRIEEVQESLSQALEILSNVNLHNINGNIIYDLLGCSI